MDHNCPDIRMSSITLNLRVNLQVQQSTIEVEADHVAIFDKCEWASAARLWHNVADHNAVASAWTM